MAAHGVVIKISQLSPRKIIYLIIIIPQMHVVFNKMTNLVLVVLLAFYLTSIPIALSVCQRRTSGGTCNAGTVRIDPSLFKVDDAAFSVLEVEGIAVVVNASQKGDIEGLDFSGCNQIATIGDYAFYNNQISSLESLPSNLVYIGYGSFAWNKIEVITLPTSLKTIGWYAFAGNNITQVTIPSSVNIIGYGAFEYNQIQTIRIPSSVTTIRDNAFFGNPLKSICYEGERPSPSVKLPTYFGIPHKVSFEKCPKSSNEDNVPNKDSSASQGPVWSADLCKKASIKGGKSSCFGNIRIDPSLVGIEKEAFEGASITGIDFMDCNKLASIGHRAFANNDIATLTIPPYVTFIGYDAFVNNKLTSLRLPSSVKNIKEGAFFGNPLTSACYEGARPSPKNEPSFFGINIPFEKCSQTNSEL